MKKSYIILFFLLICIVVSYAQTTIKFEVKLADKECSTDTTFRFAKVYFVSGGQSIKVTTFKFKGCKYIFNGKVPIGKYAVDISSTGYESHQIAIEIAAQKHIETEKIVLQKIIQLKDVNIQIEKEYIKMEGDRTTVDIKNNEMLSSGNAYEAISRLPGVIPNPSGNIMLNGKSTAVWIDGSPSNLTGQELNSYLTSLPGKALEKIELISNPGASFDANTGSGGIINLVITNAGVKSLNGSLNSSYSYNKYHKTNNSLLLSGRSQKFSWQMLGSIGYTESATLTSLDAMIDSPPITKNVYSKSTFLNDNTGIIIRPGIRYAFSKNSSFRLNYNLNLNYASPYTTGALKGSETDYATGFDQKTNNARNEIIAGYSLKLDSLNRRMEITLYGMKFGQNRLSESMQFLMPTIYNSYKNTLDIDNFYLKNDWVLPFASDGITLNFGFKVGYSRVKSNGLYSIAGSNPLIISNPQYTTEIPYQYSDNSQAVYAEFRKTFKKFNIGVGSRLERYTFKSQIRPNNILSSKHYTNLFPNINLLYKLAPSINLITNYTRKIDQVGYTQLDPNLNGYFDNFSQISGNPVLEPNFFNNYEVKLNAFGYASINFNYSFSKTKNLLYYNYDATSQKVVQTYQSFNNANVYGGSMNIPIPFKLFTEGASLFNKALNPDNENFLYINGGFLRYGFDETEQLVARNTTIWYFGLYSQVLLPAGAKLSLYYNYNGKGTYELYTLTRAIQSFDATLSRAFLKKRLKFDLTAQDIFNTKSTNARLTNNGLGLGYYQKYDSRNFRFAVSYSFGRSKPAKNIEINKDEDRMDAKGGIAPSKQ